MLNKENGKIMRNRSRFLLSVLDARGCGYSLAFFCLFVLGLAVIHPARASEPAKSVAAAAKNAVVGPVRASSPAKSSSVKVPHAVAVPARAAGGANALVAAGVTCSLAPATTAAKSSLAPAQDDPVPPIPATQAFQSPACSAANLGGISLDLPIIGHIATVPSPARLNPEWKAIILDPSLTPNRQPPQIVEGFVGPTENHNTNQQATAEVAEEDISWTHYTHDWTFKVTPDPAYQHVLSSWARFPGRFESSQRLPSDQNGCPANFTFIDDPNDPDFNQCVGCSGGAVLTSDRRCQTVPPEVCPDNTTGDTCHHTEMEVEWDNAALMDASGDDKEGFARNFGAVPEFVWPSVGDRVWVEGRWIFDCGHPGTPDADPDNPDFVKFGSEIHPPRALATFRKNRIALDSFPRPRVSEPNHPFPQSYLPVTGQPADPAQIPPGIPNNGPTQIPVAEADIYVSVNAGGAGDLCSVVPSPCSAHGGHTGPIIPVNDRNYMFDVYPPGTDFKNPNADGTFPVAPPVGDASLQWRMVNHFSELPSRACGGFDNSVCVTVDPIICQVGASTGPPPRDAIEQTNAGLACPTLQPGEKPTRLRVILPFNGSNANFFAQSILLGWDDVPAPANGTPGVRTFEVRLHEFKRISKGDTEDWREFVSVGGQWRYITPFYDTDHGIAALDGGDNTCDVGTIEGIFTDRDCFNFDNTPWTISVKDGESIHVSVGGFAARGLEDDDSVLFLCRDPNGCDQPADFDDKADSFIALATNNDDRIGTYEFDLEGPDYALPPQPHTTDEFGCQIHTGPLDSCNLQYRVTFNVKEITPTAAAPTSNGLTVGAPHFGSFVSAATPVILSSASPDVEGFQYRSYAQGSPLPVYPSTQPFPVHWAHADLPVASQSVAVFLTGADGPNVLQYSAESFGNLLEPRHTETGLVLDNTPPVVSIVQPQATNYTHSAVLTLNYSANDGAGSGVGSFAPTMDGKTSLPGGVGLQNGQQIRLLRELSLGTHTFTVVANDNVNNAGTTSVTFNIIVTPQSIQDDVRQFFQDGSIRNFGLEVSLLAILDEAGEAQTQHRCSLAAILYRVFIDRVQDNRGRRFGIDAAAADTMIADAQYLIAHCQ